MDSKTIAFITMMGALGNVLFLISYYLGQLAPLPKGVALDLSLIPTFISALYGGPLAGFVTGLFVGVLPGIFFGPLGSGSWLGLIALPVGKALTGLTAGLFYKGLDINDRSHRSILTIPLVLVSYIPECLFTAVYFANLLPYFIGGGGIGILIFVLPKAWAEIIFMSFLMGALVGNQGFSNFVNNFFARPKIGRKALTHSTD